MRIIEQSYELLTSKEFLRSQLIHIERCGRIAYKSEDKITETSAPDFIKMINGRGHGAVLEHSFLSVRFVTDRGVTHEIVRHRLASFTQESTRYCNYGAEKFGNQLTFIRPVWVDPIVTIPENIDLIKREHLKVSVPELLWLGSMNAAEVAYLGLLELGWAPQQARSVLPNNLKTEIVVTANFREWQHILRLRAVEKAAHPQMRALMIPFYQELRQTIPEIFDMGDPE